tara:strand:+ start:501 stop:686 length:186 start_codon:yes stop_codon:yes gene_type:complete
MYNRSRSDKERLAQIIVKYPLTIEDLLMIVKEYEIEDYHAVIDALEQLRTRLGKKNAEKLN